MLSIVHFWRRKWTEEETTVKGNEVMRILGYDLGHHDVMRVVSMYLVDGGLYHGRAEGLTDMVGHIGLHVDTGAWDQGKMQGCDIAADTASHADLQERMRNFGYELPPRRRSISCPGKNRRRGCISPTSWRISPRMCAAPRRGKLLPLPIGPMHYDVTRRQSHPRWEKDMRRPTKLLRHALGARIGEFEGMDLCLGRVRESVKGITQIGAMQMLPPARARAQLATLRGVGGASAKATAELMGEAARLGRRRPSE